MQWSKTKSTLEGFLCDKLKARIQIHATVYRKFHDHPARVWITLDKKEIVNAADTTYFIKYEELYEQIKNERHLASIPYHLNWEKMLCSKERQQLVNASNHAEEIMVSQNLFNSYHLYEPLLRYHTLSIDKALASENIIIRAYAMLDRRLGKRRLTHMHFNEETHPLIITFYNIRCGVEGLDSKFST